VVLLCKCIAYRSLASFVTEDSATVSFYTDTKGHEHKARCADERQVSTAISIHALRSSALVHANKRISTVMLRTSKKQQYQVSRQPQYMPGYKLPTVQHPEAALHPTAGTGRGERGAAASSEKWFYLPEEPMLERRTVL